ncbi:Riboflavin synthase eubacterial/eukaryotic [Moraxella catarrhalis]|nr:Riboflavin synthase eubacterial/eukaryotic [Moraxella catarrhalis]
MGGLVNIEVDLISRYLERLLFASNQVQKPTSSISEELLNQAGFYL